MEVSELIFIFPPDGSRSPVRLWKSEIKISEKQMQQEAINHVDSGCASGQVK